MRKPLSPSDFGFNARDSQRLSVALDRAVEARVFRRLQAVLLVAQGRGVAQAAEITGLSSRSVYYLVGRYLQSHRVENLQDQPSPERPSAAPTLTKERILR